MPRIIPRLKKLFSVSSRRFLAKKCWQLNRAVKTTFVRTHPVK